MRPIRKKRELHGGKWIEIRCEGKADFYRQAIGSGAALNKGRKKGDPHGILLQVRLENQMPLKKRHQVLKTYAKIWRSRRSAKINARPTRSLSEKWTRRKKRKDGEVKKKSLKNKKRSEQPNAALQEPESRIIRQRLRCRLVQKLSSHEKPRTNAPPALHLDATPGCAES